MTPDVSRTVGAYTIQRLLGEGAMGRVYLARQHTLDRPVALKIMRKRLSGDASFRARFLREARLAASVEHPNVLPVYDAGEIDGVLYIASRYLAGEDLAVVLAREGHLSVEATIRVAAQIAAGLEAIHDHQLIHRDLKPANVLVSTTEVLIADFGIAKPTTNDAFTTVGGFIGTPAYAAPEQLRGDALTPAVDFYALACVVFECLAGVRPFARESSLAELQARLVEPPPNISAIRRGLPPRLDAVLSKAMAAVPAGRYPSGQEFMAALEAASQRTKSPPPSVTTVQDEDSKTPAAAPLARSSRARIGARLAILLLVVSVVAALTVINVAASNASAEERARQVRACMTQHRMDYASQVRQQPAPDVSRVFELCEWPPMNYSDADGYSQISQKILDGPGTYEATGTNVLGVIRAPGCREVELFYLFGSQGGSRNLPPLRLQPGAVVTVDGKPWAPDPARGVWLGYYPERTDIIVLQNSKYRLESARCTR